MNKKYPMVKGGRKKTKIVLSVIIGVPVLLALIVLLYINGMLNKINYVDDNASSSLTENKSENTSLSNTSQPKSVVTDKTDIYQDKNVLNVLLIGSDTRIPGGLGRSDVMMLISINKKTKKIVMTSLMRDIYLSISGHGYNRLNAAYAFGGANLLMKTVENNFKIRVDNYVCVDFYSFIDVIDAIGGVTIDVNANELSSINANVREINAKEGHPSNDGLLLKSGQNILLSGKQALGYARIRHVGNSDFERTERQRDIMEQIIIKLRRQSVTKLCGIVGNLLPMVTTNLKKSQLFSLMLSAPGYAKYDVLQCRVPADGSYKGASIDNMSVLSIDLPENIANMRQNIYGITK